jgi:hypothetical protein
MNQFPLIEKRCTSQKGCKYILIEDNHQQQTEIVDCDDDRLIMTIPFGLNHDVYIEEFLKTH